MSITETDGNVNPPEIPGRSKLVNKIFVPALVVLVGVGAFGAGKLAKIEAERPAVTVDYSLVSSSSPSIGEVAEGRSDMISSSTPAKTSGNFYASRSGTAYYPVSCTAGNRILEKNKIWFDTIQEAEKFGFKAAKNCK